MKPSNVLLCLANFDSWSEEEVLQRLGEPIINPLRRLDDGPVEPTGPAYIVNAALLDKVDPHYWTSRIIIIDFGEAFYLEDPPPNGSGAPFEFCSPELMFESKLGLGSEVWALACTIYTIRTGLPLFEMFNGNPAEIIKEFVRLLGRLPDQWWQAWKGRSACFDHEAKSLQVHTGTSPVRGRPYLLEMMSTPVALLGTPLRDDPDRPGVRSRYRRRAISSMAEMEVFADLLLKMLKYNPEERMTIAESLAHPWYNANLGGDLEKDSTLTEADTNGAAANRTTLQAYTMDDTSIEHSSLRVISLKDSMFDKSTTEQSKLEEPLDPRMTTSNESSLSAGTECITQTVNASDEDEASTIKSLDLSQPGTRP